MKTNKIVVIGWLIILMTLVSSSLLVFFNKVEWNGLIPITFSFILYGGIILLSGYFFEE